MKDTKEMEIHGCVEVPKSLAEDEFWDRFISFIEKNGWYFGGEINEYKDDR